MVGCAAALGVRDGVLRRVRRDLVGHVQLGWPQSLRPATQASPLDGGKGVPQQGQVDEEREKPGAQHQQDASHDAPAHDLSQGRTVRRCSTIGDRYRDTRRRHDARPFARSALEQAACSSYSDES